MTSAEQRRRSGEPLPEEDQRKTRGVRLSDREMDYVAPLAERHGVSPSSYVRYAAMNWATAEMAGETPDLPESGISVEDLDRLIAGLTKLRDALKNH